MLLSHYILIVVVYFNFYHVGWYEREIKMGDDENAQNYAGTID